MCINTMKTNTFKSMLILAIIALLLTSCTKKQQKPILGKDTEKAPNTLKQMVEKAEDLTNKLEQIYEINQPEKVEKEALKDREDKEDKEDKEGKEDKSKDSSDKSNSSEGKDQETSKKDESKEKTLQTNQEKIITMWDNSKKISDEIHSSWSEYELLAIEKGISKEEISKFEDVLDNLTVSIDKKNILDSLNRLNNLNLNMSPFFDKYKGNNEGYLMRMKYYIRQAYLDAIKNEWDKSTENLKEALDTMNTIRARIKLDKKDQDLMERLNLSIINMNTSISKNNLELLKVKRDIVLRNIKNIMEKVL